MLHMQRGDQHSCWRQWVNNHLHVDQHHKTLVQQKPDSKWKAELCVSTSLTSPEHTLSGLCYHEDEPKCNTNLLGAATVR